MTGTYTNTVPISATGDLKIDGILANAAWGAVSGPSEILYSYPNASQLYAYFVPYASNENFGFLPITSAMATAANFALETNSGTVADNAFSVEGFTLLNTTPTTGATPANPYLEPDYATIRLAQTTSDPYSIGTAWGYYPASTNEAGDVWFTNGRGNDYTNPAPGNFAWHTILHEIGHSLGLKHGHENTDYGQLPTQYDAMEYSLMTYKSFEGHDIASTGGYSNEFWGYAQSYMMLDIAALQHMYGADFAVNGGDTVYSWTPGSGATKVNGVAAITPGANRIFATIWDGNGNDTYDLSAYTTGVQIDLKPGGASLFSSVQQANLGSGHFAKGNIYNALLYQGDTRSLIENALGGTGDDEIFGNQADNNLQGLSGNDTIRGEEGADEIAGHRGDDLAYGGEGNDKMFGGFGNDVLIGNTGKDQLFGGVGNDNLQGRAGTDYIIGDVGDDTIDGGSSADQIEGNGGKDQIFGGTGDDWIHGGAGTDVIDGGSGSDTILGGGGADLIYGGSGYDLIVGGDGSDTILGGSQSDTMSGGSGADVFVFNSLAESPIGGAEDVITDFTPGQDKIDLSNLAPGLTLSIGGGLTGTGPCARTLETGGDTQIFIDVDGNGSSDMRINLEGTTGMTAGDFLL